MLGSKQRRDVYYHDWGDGFVFPFYPSKIIVQTYTKWANEISCWLKEQNKRKIWDIKWR
jgi:hypothetical protein